MALSNFDKKTFTTAKPAVEGRPYVDQWDRSGNSVAYTINFSANTKSSGGWRNNPWYVSIWVGSTLVADHKKVKNNTSGAIGTTEYYMSDASGHAAGSLDLGTTAAGTQTIRCQMFDNWSYNNMGTQSWDWSYGAASMWNDINAYQPDGSTQNGLMFDLTTSDGGRWTNITNEPPSAEFTKAYGTTATISNIRSNITGAHYTTNSVTGGGDGTITWTFTTPNYVVHLYSAWDNYKLTINPNGGVYNGSTSNTIITQAFNTTYTLGYPTRDNYVFSHWTASRVANFDAQGAGFNVYNNNGNGTVTHTWMQSESTSGTNCDVCKIVTNGSASPGTGGFYQAFQTQASHTYYQIYRLKVPTGYTVSYASNAIGDNPVVTNLTDMAGTGDWKTYVFKLQTSSSGSFSTSGFIYLNGSNNTSVTWYVASAQVWDATDGVYRANVNGIYRYDYSASDCTLTANWKQINYYLDVNWTLDGTSVSNALSAGYASADVYINGSKVATGVGDYYTAHPYGTTYKVVATAKAGYQFSNGSTTQTIEGTIGESNVSANFAIQTKSYTVAYNANGGTSTPTIQTAKYKTAVTLASAIKKNNTDANVTITVTYNANGGSGAPGNSTGTAVNTTPYTFNKWALNSTSGTQYAAGASYTIPASNSTMYATWTTGTTTRKSNPSITLSSTKPTRSGYNFKGWSTSNTATTASYSAGTAYTFSANTTLYAVWELAQANLYTKKSGAWVKGPAYVKVGGAWKVAKQVYTKVNGAWVLNK